MVTEWDYYRSRFLKSSSSPSLINWQCCWIEKHHSHHKKNFCCIYAFTSVQAYVGRVSLLVVWMWTNLTLHFSQQDILSQSRFPIRCVLARVCISTSLHTVILLWAIVFCPSSSSHNGILHMGWGRCTREGRVMGAEPHSAGLKIRRTHGIQHIEKVWDSLTPAKCSPLLSHWDNRCFPLSSFPQFVRIFFV